MRTEQTIAPTGGGQRWPVCEVCGRPVATINGVLSVDRAAALANLHLRRVSERAREQPPPLDNREGQAGAVLILAAVEPLLEATPWQWTHLACLPPENEFVIAAERLDTPAKVLGWTLKLMEKRWFIATNWPVAVRRLHDLPHA